jgi:hypothetical protein
MLLFWLCACLRPNPIPKADDPMVAAPVDSGSVDPVDPVDTGGPASEATDGAGDGDNGGGDDGTVDTAPPWDPDAPLELCINELMPDNASVLFAADGSTPDWIELHNPGDSDIALDGWSLADEVGRSSRHVLSGGMVLPAGGFVVLYADALPESGADHLGFSLSALGGEVGLYAPDGRGQRIVYGAVTADFSVARATDCCTEEGCLGFAFRGSPGVSNTSG